MEMEMEMEMEMVMKMKMKMEMEMEMNMILICTVSLNNDRHIRGYSERTCTPLHPEDGRIRPASCTSFDSS
jgi:hypothetical protein